MAAQTYINSKSTQEQNHEEEQNGGLKILHNAELMHSEPETD